MKWASANKGLPSEEVERRREDWNPRNSRSNAKTLPAWLAPANWSCMACDKIRIISDFLFVKLVVYVCLPYQGDISQWKFCLHCPKFTHVGVHLTHSLVSYSYKIKRTFNTLRLPRTDTVLVRQSWGKIGRYSQKKHHM